MEQLWVVGLPDIGAFRYVVPSILFCSSSSKPDFPLIRHFTGRRRERVLKQGASAGRIATARGDSPGAAGRIRTGGAP
jgi:hypothetical protein